MGAIDIHNVPRELLDVLARDAASRGLTMQQYLLEVLERQGKAVRDAEFLRTWSPGPAPDSDPLPDAIQILEQSRRDRDDQILRAVQE